MCGSVCPSGCLWGVVGHVVVWRVAAYCSAQFCLDLIKDVQSGPQTGFINITFSPSCDSVPVSDNMSVFNNLEMTKA